MGWTRNEDLFQDSAMQKYHLESTRPPKKSQNLSGKGLRPSESDAASNCKDIQQNECQAPSHKPSFYDQFWYFFLYYICASQDHPHHQGRKDCSLPWSWYGRMATIAPGKATTVNRSTVPRYQGEHTTFVSKTHNFEALNYHSA